jgi:hypothetical protein
MMLLYATNTSGGVMPIKGSGQAGRVRVENVGDIDETSPKLWPDVTVSTGRNATNRTSVRQMIAAVMRSDEASMKIDTDEALVELDIGTRTVDGMRSRSDPHLEETSLLTFFPFLLGSNEARRPSTEARTCGNSALSPSTRTPSS